MKVVEVAPGLAQLGFEYFQSEDVTISLGRLFHYLTSSLERIFSLCPTGIYFVETSDLSLAFFRLCRSQKQALPSLYSLFKQRNKKNKVKKIKQIPH